jgi:ABC-type Fe3+/spermidine/putrescine transport system ATPase subunit
MEAGQIRMIGTPDEIFRKPNSCFVADFVGTANIYRDAALEASGNGVVKLHYKGKEICCGRNMWSPAEHGAGGTRGAGLGETNGKVNFCVRPENTNLHTARPAELRTNVFEGRIAEVYDRGLMFQSIVNIADDFSVVNLTMRRDFLEMNIANGSRVYLHIDENSIHIIEPEGCP